MIHTTELETIYIDPVYAEEIEQVIQEIVRANSIRCDEYMRRMAKEYDWKGSI